MERNPIIEKVQALMDGEKSHRQSRIVEIETAEGKRRGFFVGTFPKTMLSCFHGFPNLIRERKESGTWIWKW